MNSQLAGPAKPEINLTWPYLVCLILDHRPCLSRSQHHLWFSVCVSVCSFSRKQLWGFFLPAKGKEVYILGMAVSQLVSELVQRNYESSQKLSLRKYVVSGRNIFSKFRKIFNFFWIRLFPDPDFDTFGYLRGLHFFEKSAQMQKSR